MDEEIVIEQEFIEQVKAEMAKDPKLRPCMLCVHYDPEKKWCRHLRKKNMQYNYGSNCFLTNEQALRALLIQEKKRASERRAKLNAKLDVMSAMVNGADLVREDIVEMIEVDYKRIEIKGKGDDEAYRRSKRNLDRLQRCYAEMRIALQDFENAYRRYIGFWNATMFADEKGAWSPEYDKHICNAGFLTYCFFALNDSMYESDENVSAFIDFVNNLPKQKPSVLDQSDLKRYLIKI